LGALTFLSTFPERKHRVQTRRRLGTPFSKTRTGCKLGSHRRREVLCAWLI